MPSELSMNNLGPLPKSSFKPMKQEVHKIDPLPTGDYFAKQIPLAFKSQACTLFFEPSSIFKAYLASFLVFTTVIPHF